jgi:hypothetical protein
VRGSTYPGGGPRLRTSPAAIPVGRPARAKDADLLGESDVVTLGPVLGHSPVFDPVDVDRLDVELPARGRLAHELACMGASRGEAHGHAIAVGERIEDLVGQVGERPAQPSKHGVGALRPHGSSGRRLVIDVIRGHELLGSTTLSGFVALLHSLRTDPVLAAAELRERLSDVGRHRDRANLAGLRRLPEKAKTPPERGFSRALCRTRTDDPFLTMVPPGGRKPVVTGDSVRLGEVRRGHICRTRTRPGTRFVPVYPPAAQSVAKREWVLLAGPSLRWLRVAVQKLGSRVQAVGPDHRPRFLVDASLPEVLRITQRLTQRSVEQEGAVNVSHDPVVEFDSEPMALERLDISDMEHSVNATPADRSERAARAPGPAPSCRPTRWRAAQPIHEQAGAHEAATSR